MNGWLKLPIVFERWQVVIYFLSVIAAFLFSSLYQKAPFFEIFINPALALMLFVTFLQVPLASLTQVFKDFRFLSALLFGNFIAIPCLVFGLSSLFTLDFFPKMGVLMVLLMPCIDYVVTFCHMGKGDSRSLLAATALLLFIQILMLPLYLALFLNDEKTIYIDIMPFIYAFFWLIFLPLCLAALMQFWAKKQHFGHIVKQSLDILPVPATALVLFVVVFTVMTQLKQSGQAVLSVVPIYSLYALLAPLLGLAIAFVWRLNSAQKRTIAFSMATRNSLVIMPMVLAIPNAMPLLPAIIITQTLIELMSQLVYVAISKRL